MLLLEFVPEISLKSAVVSTQTAEYAIRTIVFRRRAEFWDDSELHYFHTHHLPLDLMRQKPIELPYRRRDVKFERYGNNDFERAVKVEADILDGPTIVTSYASVAYLIVEFDDFDFSLIEEEEIDGIELSKQYFFKSNLIPEIKIPTHTSRSIIVEKKADAQEALTKLFKARDELDESKKRFLIAQSIYRAFDPNQILLGQYNQAIDHLDGGAK